MDLAELGVVATQDGVKETADGLDRLSQSAVGAEDSVNKFNSKSGETKTATDAMNGGLDGSLALFTNLGPMILGAVAALATFAAGALSLQKFVDATSEAEFNQAQLAAALKSTGGASGQTIEALNAQAEALQNLTTYEDDTINKAQAVMLTFTKISGDIFPKATEAAANLATRMGTDLTSATLQVGKALNDPIKGISALSRAGIQFTDDQKQMIEGFVNANNIIGAQKIILQELETQFGGSAEAARATLGGAIEALTNAFGNLFEVSGPGSEDLRVAIEGLITAMNDPAFKDFANTIGTVMFAALQLAVEGFKLLVDAISSFWAYAGPTIKEFGSVMWDLGSVIIPALIDTFKALWGVVEPIITYFLEGWKDVYDVISEILGIQDQVKPAPSTATPTATDKAAAVPSATAAKTAADTMNKGITTAATTAANTMNKGVTTGGTTAADAAVEASKVGAATLANSFGEGADAVSQAASDGGGIIGAQIAANAEIMSAKFEGTGRNIYDLWNNWGNSFIDSFGTTIGDLLIDFQRAQTEQLEAQADLFKAQAALTREQLDILEHTGEMPGTASSSGGGSGGSGGGKNTTSGGIGFGTGGGAFGSDLYGDKPDKDRRDRRSGSRNIGGGNTQVGVDPGPDKPRKWTPLDERGNIELNIINQSDPRDTLANLNTSRGKRTITNSIGSDKRRIRQILGIRG